MKWLLRRYMCEQRISGISELARVTGIKRQHLYDLINEPHRIKIFELRALDEVLHFKDDDLLRLMREI